MVNRIFIMPIEDHCTANNFENKTSQTDNCLVLSVFIQCPEAEMRQRYRTHSERGSRVNRLCTASLADREPSITDNTASAIGTSC